MKVLIVSFYYFPELGAAPSRITNLAEGLHNEGIDVDVLTTLPNYPKGKIFEGYRNRLSMKETVNGVNVYRYWTYATVTKNPVLRAWGMSSFALMIWLFAFKRNLIRSYDRVIVQSPPLFVSYSAMVLFKKVFKRKVILNVSDLWPLSAIELGAIKKGTVIYKIFSSIEKYIYKNADGVFGQSKEIIQHIDSFPSPQQKFLYRNLQRYDLRLSSRTKGGVVKIVYAGLLGVAQDILGIVQNVDFKSLGVELHLYGGGNQTSQIETYISQNDINVFYHGYIDKSEMDKVLSLYDASIVPLAVKIKGAVPSKIFDLLPLGIPILFCGGGEGAEIIKEKGIGFVSEPGDYQGLSDNIKKLVLLTDVEYAGLVGNCQNVARTEFDFNKQIRSCCQFINRLR